MEFLELIFSQPPELYEDAERLDCVVLTFLEQLHNNLLSSISIFLPKHRILDLISI